MSYKVLYRKYRPNDFENVIGQDYTITTLKNSIINHNISHAYIFSGPRGTGKTSTAKVFAKAINCENPHDGSPCNECIFCQNFVENPDIIEIDAASNNGVDQIRSLIDNVKLTPTNGKYKVYIIDEVHMLTTSAFNALLLTLEEPPAHAVFILATTNIENVPITILSRCQRFDFQKISSTTIVNSLKKICELEKINASDDALLEIAYLSDGGMRDALSLLDQLSKNNCEITVEMIESQIKTVSRAEIRELMNFVESNDVNSFINRLKDYSDRAVDYKTLVKKCMDEITERAKLLKLGSKIERMSFADYKKLLIDLSDSLTRININVDPYSILEVIFLDYFSVSNNMPNSPEYDKKLSSDVENSVSKTSIKNNVDENNLDLINKMTNVRINNCFAAAKKEELNKVKEKFYEFVSSIKVGTIKSILQDSKPVAASENYIIMSTMDKYTAEDGNMDLKNIDKLISDFYKANYKVIFVSDEKWNEERQIYIENVKNGYQYKIQDEPENVTTDAQPIIDDVFNIDKIEIE